jgi:hypothetical protein
MHCKQHHVEVAVTHKGLVQPDGVGMLEHPMVHQPGNRVDAIYIWSTHASRLLLTLAWLLQNSDCAPAGNPQQLQYVHFNPIRRRLLAAIEALGMLCVSVRKKHHLAIMASNFTRCQSIV